MMAFLWKINDRLEKLFSLENNRLAAGIYYLSHAAYQRKIPFLPFLLMRLNAWLHGAEIYYRAEIGKGLRINHSQGIVIGPNVRMGIDCTVYSSVVLGVRYPFTGLHPQIGDHVILGSGSKVLGNIMVGDHSIVAANAVVLDDVPAFSTVAGVPAKIVAVRKDEGIAPVILRPQP